MVDVVIGTKTNTAAADALIEQVKAIVEPETTLYLGGCPRINVCGLLILGERGGACVPIDAPVETASDSDRNAQFTEGLTPCKGPCGTPQASALRLRR